VSRGGARKPEGAAGAGTPIWVWLVYGLGILAATILVASALFTAGAFLLSEDVPVTVNASAVGILLWGGLLLLAVATWLSRRRRR
jgi:LPXTG-motif cell wall-anchored protein